MRFLSMAPVALALTLAGCGGEDAQSYLPGQLQDTPGGVYVGAYVETASDDPDPSVGGLYLNLPKNDGSAEGQMSYQQRDCQTRNTLDLTLQKVTNDKLKLGVATGNVDQPVDSQFPVRVALGLEGAYNRSQDTWSGFYTRSGRSTEARTAPGCLDYHLASAGRWMIWPLASGFPSGFAVTANAQTGVLQWPVVPGASKTLVMLLDPALLTVGSADAFELQRVQPALPATFQLPAHAPAQKRRAVVMVFDAQNTLLAAQSVEVTR
jgi:hypothetical protein